MRILIALMISCLLVPSVEAGWFDRRSETQKPKHNRQALIEDILNDAGWATHRTAEDVIKYFNRRYKRISNETSDMAFLVIEYGTLVLGGVAYAEGKSVVIQLNYVPEPFQIASLRQAFDCDVTLKRRKLTLRFRNAVDSGLLMHRDNRGRPVLRVDSIIKRLTYEGSPFDSVRQFQ